MSDEKPITLKRKAKTSTGDTDSSLKCIVHYEHCHDNEVRPLSDSQFATLCHSKQVRQAQITGGNRLDNICGQIPRQLDATIHGSHR